MEAVMKPRGEAGLRRRKIDARHPDLGKSQFTGPGLRLVQPERKYALTALDRHLPILGTAARAFRWQDEDATRDFAEALARNPAIGDAYIELHGDLGAGKTLSLIHI